MSDLPLNAMTVDVEDYFQVEAFSGQVSRDRWDEYPLRVESSTNRVLDLFDRFEVKGTFFVLGWVARKLPGLVQEIARRGHEIGCHSFWHRLVFKLEPEEFRQDLREATRTIEDAAQTKLCGYRAPTYSITRESLWALEILGEEGYEYDSSIFPIRHDVYGLPDFPRFPVRVDYRAAEGSNGAPVAESARASIGAGTITEFPPSTVKVLGKNLPGPGGGFLRIFPLRYALWALRRISRRDQRPATVYIHPWEVDPEQPRMAGPLRSKLRHYTGLRHTEKRLERILGSFRFAPMGEVLEAHPPEQTCTTAELIAAR